MGWRDVGSEDESGSGCGVTVGEYWQEVLALELSYAAHLVYWALREGYVCEADDWSSLVHVPYRNEAEQLWQENVLGVGTKGFL